MVEIPTSRSMSRVDPASGRAFVPGPRASIGDGLQQAGRSMQGAAFDMMDVADRTVKNERAKNSYDMAVEVERFRADEEARFLKSMDEAPASGIGFTSEYIAGHQKRVDEFATKRFVGLDERADAQYRESMLALGRSLYQKADTFESKAKTGYYDGTTNTSLDRLRKSIRVNGAPFEDLKRQGADIISAADMPEAWKAERLKAWDADAAASSWEWEFEENPEQAVAELKGGREGYFAAIRQAESGGNDSAKNPGSTATGRYQFIQSTWNALVDRHPDTGLTKDGRLDPKQQEIAIRLFTEENADALAASGIEATNGNLYAAHFLGAGGARQVLSASDGANVSDIVSPGVIKANPFLRGMTVSDFKAWASKKAGGGKYDDIPYERQQKMIDDGERDIASNNVKRAASTVDSYQLQIATNPQLVTKEQILSEGGIDDGQKAGLIKSLDAANKEGAATRSAFERMQAGEKLNPFEADDRKGVDGMYKAVMDTSDPAEAQSVAEQITRVTGVVPKQYVNGIRNGLNSQDPKTLAQALSRADRLVAMDRQAVEGGENGGDLLKASTAYRHYTDRLGLTPEEAAKRYADANDPDKVREREALLKSKTVTDKIKTIDEAHVSDRFDPGFFGFDPKLGEGPAASAAMVADYRDMYEESVVEAGGDLDLADDLATQKFKRLYGVSELSTAGPGVVIKLPPENTYPPLPDGSHGYLQTQALESLKDEGVEASNVMFQALPDTERAFSRGQVAPYAVFYERADKIEQYPYPFAGDPEAGLADYKARIAAERAENVERARRANERGREQEQQRQQIIDSGGRGPSPLGDMDAAAEEARRIDAMPVPELDIQMAPADPNETVVTP